LPPLRIVFLTASRAGPLLFGVGVQAITIRTFDDHDVDIAKDLGVLDQREVPATEVHGKGNAPRAAVFTDGEGGQGGAQDMTRIVECHRKRRGELNDFAILVAAQKLDCLFGIVHGVDRNNGLKAFAICFLVQVLGVLFLDPRRVTEHDLTERGRGRRRMDRATVTLARERWRVTTVVDMRVREDHCIERSDVERESTIDLSRLLATTLIQPAVTQNHHSVDFDKMLRSCHGFHSAKKMNFHRLDFFSLISYV